jgi:hypothetical protein
MIFISIVSICGRIWLGSGHSVGSKYWPIRHLGIRSVCFVGRRGGVGVPCLAILAALAISRTDIIYTVYSSALFSATSKQAPEPIRRGVLWIQPVRLAGGKWTERDADHSPASDGKRSALHSVLFFMGVSYNTGTTYC